MQFTVDRAPLLEAVARVQSAAGNGKSIPILGMVLLRAEAGRLSVRATDNVLEATAHASATTEIEGATCVAVDQLHELVRSLPEGAEIGFALEASDPRLSVVCGRARFKLPVLQPADFPAWAPSSAAEVAGPIRADQFARLIDKTLFAVGTDATRYYLSGVHLCVVGDGEGAKLRAVATNGALLAQAETPCPPALAGLAPVTLPTRFAAEARRWLGAREVEVEFGCSERQIRLELGEARLRSLTIDGRFPDYQRVVPRGLPHLARLDVGLLRQAVRRVIVAAQLTENSKIKVVRASFAAGKAAFASRSAERGEAQEEIEAQFDDLAGAVLALNSAQLLAIAERLGGGKLDLAFDDNRSPILITDPDDAASLFVMTTVLG